MSNYRRNYQAGGIYFFTVVMYKRQQLFTDTATVNLLRDAFKTVRSQLPFEINASVILPDHLHCIWSLPNNDNDFSTRWKKIKTHFTKGYKRRVGAAIVQPTQSVQNKGEIGIWQRRFWEHTLRDEFDYNKHCDYIHYNPVKHGLVEAPSQWPYSSFSKYVKRGIYSKNWVGPVDEIELAGNWD